MDFTANVSSTDIPFANRTLDPDDTVNATESGARVSLTDILVVNKTVNINDTVDTTASGTKASFLLYDYLIPTIGSLIIVLNLVVVVSSGLILKKGK